MTWEAPFLYERWMLSFPGEGGRRECWPSEGRRLDDQGSGGVTVGGGVSIGELPRLSDSESAWKNLVSGWVRPTADNGGDDAEEEDAGVS